MSSFLKWLKGQHERDDSVGQLSRMVIKSKKRKPLSSNYYEWLFYIDRVHSPNHIKELNDTWKEYSDFKKSIKINNEINIK
jgi:hypothetical protein